MTLVGSNTWKRYTFDKFLKKNYTERSSWEDMTFYLKKILPKVSNIFWL